MTRKWEGFNTLSVRVSFITEQGEGFNTLALAVSFVSNVTEEGFHLLIVFFSFSHNDKGSTPSPFAFLSLPINSEGSTPLPLLFLLFPTWGGFFTFSSQIFSFPSTTRVQHSCYCCFFCFQASGRCAPSLFALFCWCCIIYMYNLLI